MVATLPASDAMSAAAAGNIIPPRAGRRNRRPDDGTARYFAGRLPRLTMPECPARPEYPERSRRSFEAVSRLEGKYAGRATRRLARRAAARPSTGPCSTSAGDRQLAEAQQVMPATAARA